MGVAWLCGFGTLWLIDGLRPAFSVPVDVAATVFGGLIVVAIVTSIVLGIRNTSGVRSTLFGHVTALDACRFR